MCQHITNENLTYSVQGKQIYKDDCERCYENPFSPLGIDVCLKCFVGNCRSDIFNHSELHTSNFSHPITLNLRKVQIKDEEKKEEVSKITKLAIGKPGGIDYSEEKWEQWCTVHCNICKKDIEIEHNNQLKSLVESVSKAASVQQESNIKEWEEEIFPCEHTLTLQQEIHSKVASKMNAHCQNCNLSSNLWMCLTCGFLGCGRKNYDGSGGNNHAREHSNQTKHPLVVKTGTITPEGDASLYCYSCDNDVKDQQLAEHLINLGVDIKQQVKTEKTMTEMNLEMNLNFTLSKIVEEGRTLVKLYGPGFTGLENLGNSCYMASVIQVLFSLEHFQLLYLDQALEHLSTCKSSSVDCFYCQLSKIMYGIHSGVYSVKKTKTLPDTGKGEEIEEYQDGIKPSSFKNFFAKGHKEFSSARQQDSLDYMSYLLEKIERQEKMANRPNPKTPFEFDWEVRLQCQECKIVKYTKTTNFYLNLQIPNWESKKEKGSIVNINECIEKFLSDEIVELNCKVCQKNSSFTKSNRILNFPAYLIIVFERFVYDWVPLKLDVEFSFNHDKIDFSILNRSHSNQNEKVLEEANVQEELDYELVDPEFNVNALNELIMNGIPELAAKNSLLNTGNNSSEEAMNWYFMNMESDIVNKPVEKVKVFKNKGKAQVKVNIPEEKIQMLIDFGFSRKRAEFALSKCDNDVERSCDYLFSHEESEDTENTGSNNVNSSGALVDLSKFNDKNKNSSVFNLYGFITHLGASTSAGHYVSHIKKQGDWVLFNDSKVAKTNDAPFSKGYLYFFKNENLNNN